MPKNIVKKTTRPLNPKPGVTQSRIAYPAEQRGTDEQQGRFTKTAPVVAGDVKTPAPAVRVEFSPTPTKVPSKPPAGLRPSSVPPRKETNPSQGSPSQKAPVTASALKVSPAVASTTPKALVQPVPPRSPEKSAFPAQTPKRTEPQTVTVNFAFFKPDAKQVLLCGEFNGWSRNAIPMKRHHDGHWEATVALAPGRYQYKFIVDGEWITDPKAQENVRNYHGTLNSVIEVH